jgi:hypothetical protein
MSDGSKAAAGLRERLTSGTEDKLGRALSDLFDNPLVSGAIGRASDARERAAQAQEVWFGALNIPTAAAIERLTRRLRSVSQRLEGIEDGVHRLNRALSDGGIDRRLSAVEDQLKTLTGKLSDGASKPAARATRSAGVAKSGRSPSTARAVDAARARKAARPASSARASKAKKSS